MKAEKMAYGKEGFPINTFPSGGTTTHKQYYETRSGVKYHLITLKFP